MRVGVAASASVSISRDLEMSQFWQNRHDRLQPAVPNVSTDVPGRKWLSGFFSIGSTQKPLERPHVYRTIMSSCRPRTKHSPRWPSCSLQARGQTSHWILPSSSRCQWVVATASAKGWLWDGVGCRDGPAGMACSGSWRSSERARLRQATIRPLAPAGAGSVRHVRAAEVAARPGVPAGHRSLPLSSVANCLALTWA